MNDRIKRNKAELCHDAGFEILDHPADMGLRVWAPGLETLFSTAGEALTTVLFDRDTIEKSCEQVVEVKAADLELLLYNWLSEILFLFDAEGLIFSTLDIMEVDSDAGVSFLRARARGQVFDPEIHQVKTYVKAVTLHQLQISRLERGYEAVIYLDI